MIESSRRDNVVLCDVAVARVLLGYFTPTPIAEIPEIHVSAGILELTSTRYFKRTDVHIEQGKGQRQGSRTGRPG